MTWSKAIKKIERASSDDALDITIIYHRKWMPNDSHIGHLDSVVEYDWRGEKCKAVSLKDDMINEDSHIIDEVIADYFFGTQKEA